MLSQQDRATLLSIARESIATGLVRGRGRRGGSLLPDERFPSTGDLAAPAGAFVTIHLGRNLRGCIGYIAPEIPLARVVAEVALKAALEDPRFSPLTQAELARSDLEISVLSPPEPLLAPEEIVIGKHGLIVEKGGRRGLLLPQVATEYGWTREEFLAHTCGKAGLPPGAWKEEETKVFLFNAEVFGEPTDHGTAQESP
jgi:AmmeMemoRadiSam system protein A